MEYREKILTLARTQPLLPNIVAKSLGVTSIMAGAMLSEMCSKQLLKTSALRVGGSPLYYIPGNETQLLAFEANLNEKDKKTMHLLREQKIIRENETDPLTRVSLSTIKDFAHPLLVSYNDKQERFFKWFQLPDKDAEELIRSKLEPQQPPQFEPTPNEKQQEKPTQQTLSNIQQKTNSYEQQTTQHQTPKPTPPTLSKSAPKETSDTFWEKINNHFTNHNIKIIEKTMNKKGDYDLTLSIPSPIGTITCYCKARTKKKITEADISQAYINGQLRKLPIVYLTDGEYTKKAQELLTKLTGVTLHHL